MGAGPPRPPSFGTATAGSPVWIGDGPPATATSILRDPGVAVDLSGPYAIAAFDEDRGRVFADVMGLRYLYLGTASGRFVVGTNAEVVARLAHHPHAPARSANVVALAANGYRWPHESGFEGVRVLDPGEAVTFVRGAMPRVETPTRWPWFGEPTPPPETELIVAIGSLLERSMAAALSSAAGAVVDLTGGKDSRLLLALVLLTATHDLPPFRTVGPEDLADVRIARRLAARTGVEHRVTLEARETSGRSFSEMAERFVRRTYGQVNLWEVRPLAPPDRTVRVSGLNGESLRAHVALRGPADAPPNVRRVSRYVPHTTLGLLTPEAARALDAARAAQVAQCIEMVDRPTMARAVDSVLFCVRARQRFGPLDELQDERRLLPLYVPGAVRAAFALPDAARHADIVHRSIIERADAGLLAEPLAKGEWSGVATVGSTSTAADRSSADDDGAPTPPARSPSVLSQANERLAAERTQLFEELLSDRANPAWDRLDRAAVRSALDSFSALRVTGRRELFGAMTAALWLRG